MANGLKVGVFSGRFDPPNLGHILTINDLLKSYNFLIVPILDYMGREGCPANIAKRIFEWYFQFNHPQSVRAKVKFLINQEHFGQITRRQYDHLLRDCGITTEPVVYLSGNAEVLSHMDDIGVPSEFVPRVSIPHVDQYLFESTKIRKEMQRSGKDIQEYYNIKY